MRRFSKSFRKSFFMPTSSSQLTLSPAAAARIMPRIEELAAISESTDGLTRRFASVEHRRANNLVANWMADAGMSTKEDAIGNIVGRYEANSDANSSNESGANAKAIMLGSHLDTVIDAGRFDGMLGVLSALACVETLHENSIRLPYAIEVIGFADEEGVRYQSTFLGSRAVSGEFNAGVLDRIDTDGIRFSDALTTFGQDATRIPSAKRSPDELLAYIELHIEQGPVLEVEDQAAGAVSGIAGATRLNIMLEGLAGHAGTVPMNLRQDALAAAAQCIALVEQQCHGHAGLVGTVGRINVQPGAGNVIPGNAQFSIDIRAQDDDLRTNKVDFLLAEMTNLCKERNIKIEIDRMHDASTVTCSDHILMNIEQALIDEGIRPIVVPSGAGHDAAAMAAITPVGMVFVRCKGGISHHPDESVTDSDARQGANVLFRTVQNLCAAPV